MIKEGGLCGDEGYKEIDSENDCKVEAEKRGIFYREGYEGRKRVETGYPKGCYLDSFVHFNTHSVGSRQEGSSPICIIHGKLKYL